MNGPVGLASRDGMAYVAWDDSRNSTAESQTQDVYFTRMRRSADAILTAQREPSWADKVTWALLGVTIALAVGGAALLLARRFSAAHEAGMT